MAPKKKDELDAVLFAEAEKNMYEMQIADIQRKLSRLRNVCKDFEIRNKDLEDAYTRLDEERAENIASLKRMVAAKSEENDELRDRIKNLHESRREEIIQFNNKVKKLEERFTNTKNHLSSENKLLCSKLNALDEFRGKRQELVDKYEKQQQDLADQEMKYKRIVYDLEIKFVLDKDRLIAEKEGRLLQLAQDFQDDSEKKITPSTQRVIRENIALNNTFNSMLMTQAKVKTQNERLKEREKQAVKATKAAEIVRDIEINKNVIQLKVIQQLKAKYNDMKEKVAAENKRELSFPKIQSKFQSLTKENESMLTKMRLLEHKLHICLGEQTRQRIETAKYFSERDSFKKIVKDTIFKIREVLKTDQWAAIDSEREILDRRTVFRSVLKVVMKYMNPVKTESTESLISLGKIYEVGDLGFVPKSHLIHSRKASETLTPVSAKSVSLSEIQASLAELPSSLASLKTIPSKLVLPAKENEGLVGSSKSYPSLTSLSQFPTDATLNESKQSVEEKGEVEKLLEKSMMEIQKSILKDLAMVSMVGVASMSRVDFEQPKTRRSIADVSSEVNKSQTAPVIATEVKDGETKSNGDETKDKDEVGTPVDDDAVINGDEKEIRVVDITEENK